MTTSPAHLLVIDNDTTRQAALVQLCHEWGWYTVTAPAAARLALAQMATYAFDLVLLALDAAELNDYAFLRQVAADDDLNLIPVVIIAPLSADVEASTAIQERIGRCLAVGARDYLLFPAAPALIQTRLRNAIQEKRWREQARSSLAAFNEIERIADDLRLVILPIGAALSAETDENLLLERIVREASRICNADAGTLYLVHDGQLHYVFTQVGSLGISFGGATGRPVPYQPITLKDPLTGAPNEEHVAAYVALNGESINLANIYQEDDFDFSGMATFDEDNDYASVSCLTVPLRNGRVVGVLQLLNAQDRETGQTIPFDAYHQQVAESLASQAAVLLNNRLLQAEQMTLLRYRQELEIGRQIQAGFFPAFLPQPPGWEVAARFRAAREVAGDFFDAYELPGGRLMLIIADVCDKGVVAALFMALIRSLLRAFIQQHLQSPNLLVSQSPISNLQPPNSETLLQMVRHTNAYITNNHLQAHMFATLFCALLDPATGDLTYVNCGHIPPLVLMPTADDRDEHGNWQLCDALQPSGPAIGLMPNATYRAATTMLPRGSLLFAYTDGIIEARDPQQEQFGNGRLQTLLEYHDAEGPKASAAALLKLVEEAVVHHMAGSGTSDDLAMLALRRMDDNG